MNCEYWKYITKKMEYNFHDDFFLEVLPKLLPWYRVNKYVIFALTQLCLKNKNMFKYFKTEKYIQPIIVQHIYLPISYFCSLLLTTQLIIPIQAKRGQIPLFILIIL